MACEPKAPTANGFRRTSNCLSTAPRRARSSTASWWPLACARSIAVGHGHASRGRLNRKMETALSHNMEVHLTITYNYVTNRKAERSLTAQWKQRLVTTWK
eukprot:6592467-Heterocapsa_arctica.AAC.1